MKSQFSDAAAIFHITRVWDAITMVFLICSSYYSFFSDCEQDDNGGFERSKEEYHCGIMCITKRSKGCCNFSEYRIVFVRSVQLRLDLIVSTNIQQHSNFCIVPVLSSIHHLAIACRKHLEMRNLDSPMNADLKPPQKQVCDPDCNPLYTHPVNAITHTKLGFNVD